MKQIIYHFSFSILSLLVVMEYTRAAPLEAEFLEKGSVSVTKIEKER